MTLFSRIILCTAAFACLLPAGLTGCKATENDSNGAAAQPLPINAAASAPPQTADEAPPPEKTGGFDGKRAFAQVVKQVSFGPRPSGSQAIVHLQDYLQSELKSYGCGVETDFVGADDGGSSTGVMLELARLLCPQHGKYAVWIAFFDGEEAVKVWSDSDSRYGSRQMSAKLAASGDLKKIRAFLLADIVGGRTARFLREDHSTPTLVDLIWNTSANLGYSAIFPNETTSAQDDHDSFLKRGVPSVDVIGDFLNNGYWHTPQDTLDKISPKTQAIVGHVFLESVKQLQAK